ncbi:hypothetical protein AB0K92_13900 [Streptomyces sp. NPDC052687]|uniref:hypothetical protein n=1 Tax=Streptomyces sp. NPDC052687 TaxID=3154759 RepID=UPI0034482438
MDVELLPHVGVAAFRLGMPFDDAVAEARTWGRVEHSPEGGRPPGKYVVVNETYQFEFVLLFEAEDKEELTGIEVWRFRDEAADIRLLWRASTSSARRRTTCRRSWRSVGTKSPRATTGSRRSRTSACASRTAAASTTPWTGRGTLCTTTTFSSRT